MSFSAASSSSVSSEINVTPLIDVLLVLLIIFMVIVPVTPRGLESRIPQPKPSADNSQQPVSVRVLAGPSAGEVRYELDGQAAASSGLAAGLQERLSVGPQRSVWIAAAPQVGYRVVAEVVSQAKSAGAVTVGLARL